MKQNQLNAHAVILAGGRGTRFWPRSRTRTPKQLLNIIGERTMLEQTVARLTPVLATSRIWTVTNDEQLRAVRAQLPSASRGRVLAEPVGRNTAAAIGLAAIHILHEISPHKPHKPDENDNSGDAMPTAKPDALMAVLPADHYIAKEKRFQSIMRTALEVADQPGHLVVLGIPPTRPETGFGYIERAPGKGDSRGVPVFRVRRFTEKPALSLALQYVKSGRYHWNAGMFFWRVSTVLECLKKFLPETYAILMRIAEVIGTRQYQRELRIGYQRLKSISIDYGIMESAVKEKKSSRSVFVLPAEVGWSDLGSWAAVYELSARNPLENVSVGNLLTLDAQGNYFWSPQKLVAAIGVRNLVVVETPDALLVCPRDRAQDVAKIVKLLEGQKRSDLL